MDTTKLHQAAGEAALFQRATLAHLSHDSTHMVMKHGQKLVELLAELGFTATSRTEDADI